MQSNRYIISTGGIAKRRDFLKVLAYMSILTGRQMIEPSPEIEYLGSKKKILLQITNHTDRPTLFSRYSRKS